MAIKQARGFTLLELTLVIATIGVLAAILLPALARAREAGRRTSCMSNLIEINQAFHMYASENRSQLPWSGGAGNVRCINRLRRNYLADPAVLLCPSDANGGRRKSQWEDYLKDAAKANRTPPDFIFTSYMYLGWFTTAPLTLPPAEAPLPRVPLMWDLIQKGGAGDFFNHIPGGCNVVWMDGSTQFVVKKDFYSDIFPAAPGNVPLGDTSVDPWREFNGEDGGIPGRRR